MTAPALGTSLISADVVLTPTLYAYRVCEHDQVVTATTTAYTTREPGLLIRSDAEKDDDGPRWVVLHWQGEAIQGFIDYASPWQALIVADQLGALGVDWTRPGDALKASGTPDGLWDALATSALADRAGEILEAVTTYDDITWWDGHEAIVDLLAAGWDPAALTGRLREVSTAIPLAARVRPLLDALAPLEGRPPWCGSCVPVARQAVDARGWLTRCPHCHPAHGRQPGPSAVVVG